MGSDVGDGVQAPESPLAKQHSGAMRGSATTSVPGSPSEDAAAAALASEAGPGDCGASDRGDSGGQAATNLQQAGAFTAAGAATAAGGGQGDDAASDDGSIYPDSDGPGGGDGLGLQSDANGLPAEGQDAQTELQQALARISQLEDQNVALWQELQNDSGGDVSSDGGSPTARDSGDGTTTPATKAAAQRPSGSGGLTKRISGRFSDEAFAAKEQELSFLQQRCIQFEMEVEQEFEELNEQLFNAQQRVHELQQSLNESEAKRRQMESAKLMVEAKLQETGQQLMECERQLITANARRAAERPKDVTNGGASAFASDSPREGEDSDAGPLLESPGTPPSSARRAGHPFFNSLLENEVEQLRDENEALMVELVQKKMALAELSESYARVKRDLHRREAKDRAVSSKMSRMHAILGGGDPSRMLRSSPSPSFSREKK